MSIIEVGHQDDQKGCMDKIILEPRFEGIVRSDHSREGEVSQADGWQGYRQGGEVRVVSLSNPM